jgi:hypothetical protein
MLRPSLTVARILRIVLLAGLACFYVIGATASGRDVNTLKARGDQNGYLWDAEQVYANWHTRTAHPHLIGERVRGVVYPAYLALFYNPRMSDPDFFEVAKSWNIRLSVVLLGILAFIFARYLPPLASTNLLLIVAFGYFIFKAGYAQVELLLYFLVFVTFLVACRFLVAKEPRERVVLGVLTGVLAGVTQLTKATMSPFVALLLLVFGVQELIGLLRRKRAPGAPGRPRRALWGVAAGLAVAVCFLATIYPYIANSKRVFGEYFYNTNTSIYMWYDTGAEARAQLLSVTDGSGLVLVSRRTLPTLGTYWRSHSLAQIASRFREGLEDLVWRSYTAFAYWPFLVLYVVFTTVVIAANRKAFSAVIRQNVALFTFLVLYGIVYLLSVAFFVPISSTGGMRFFLAHVAPLLFVLSVFMARPPFSETRWRVAGMTLTPRHFNLLVSAMLAFVLVFRLWPRLMSTYGGF